jgi:hypothetical protein
MSLVREDLCILCGQEFVYTDDQINGEVLPPLPNMLGYGKA